MKTACYKDRFSGHVLDQNPPPESSRGKSGAFFRILFVILLCLGSGVFGHIICVPTPVGESSTAYQTPEWRKMAPPQYLLINGEQWSVWPYGLEEFSPKNGRTMAMTSCEQRAIWYDPVETSPAALREHMWHEIIHAGFCKKQSVEKTSWFSFTQDSKEHLQVYELGMFLPGFVHDNPEFMKWAENWQ